MARQAGRIALTGIAAVAMSVPLLASASAATYDRHEVARTQVTVRATTGHLALARIDVLRVGGKVVRTMPTINGFVAQVPVTALLELRKAPGIVSVVAVGAPIQQ